MMFDTVASALPSIQAGLLRPLAVTTAKRSSALPDVPTMDEAGIADFEAAGWAAILAPAGTPENIVDLLSAESEKILRDPDMQQRIIALGMEPASSTPQEFKVFLKEQLAKWKQAVELAGLKSN